MVTLRITADVPSTRQVLITLPPNVPLGENELEIRVSSSPPAMRGVSGSAVRGIAQGSGSPPDDATVEEWIAEHRARKYG